MKYRTFLYLAATIPVLAIPPSGRAANQPPQQESSQAGDLKQQEQELRARVKANPDDAAAHLKLADVLISQSKYQAAADEARAAQKSPLKDQADAKLAFALSLAHDTSVLLAQIKPGEREAHAESMVRLSLGYAHFNQLEMDQAEPLLSDAVRLDPENSLARVGYGRFLTVRRRLPEAHEQIEAAQKIGGPPSVTLAAGELARAEGKTDEAIADFTKVIDLHPNSLAGLSARADALLSQDKLAEAQRDIDAALKHGVTPNIMFLKALVLARQGDMAQADHVLAKISGSFGNLRIGYYLHGVVKFALGESETADYYIAKFQADQPDIPGPAYLLAEMALRRKDPVMAIRLLQPIVQTAITDQEAVTRLARAYLFNGQQERVVELYHEVTHDPVREVEPKLDMDRLQMLYGDAAGDLVEIEKVAAGKRPEMVAPMIALRLGQTDKAAALAEPLAAKSPDDPAIQNLLGSVRLAQRQMPEAEAIFRGIIGKHPDFLPAAFNLAEVLVATNRLDDAQSMLTDLAQRAAGG